MYQGNPLMEIPEKAFSFVYILRHEATGKAYIGKKLFWFSKTKQVKGKKKRVKVESDWREYFSSSEEIKEMVAQGEHFSREIYHICDSKGTANYLEAREQMDARVLENPEKWFNGIINCRVAKSHIKSLPWTA
jgi:hypothetical protein